MAEAGIPIHDIEPGSIAAGVGLKPGYRLLEVNHIQPEDILEYKEAILGEKVVLKYQDEAGRIKEVTIQKDPYSELGIIFESSLFSGIKRCRNNCTFCFVRQLPKGMRRTLYVKDDDFRLSFLEGSFITLTNLTEADYDRIIQSRLSPLYISVHTFNPELRQKLMGNPRAGKIKEQLSRLAAGGIQFHLQLVLIPGVNDGPELERSLEEVEKLGEACLSLGVVPVGLTAHRKSLPEVRLYTPEAAGEVLDTVHRWQARLFRNRGERVVHAADEFYWIANHPIPPEEVYEGYPQLENGIGLTRLFWNTFEAKLTNPGFSEKFLLVTGVSGAKVLQPLVLSLPRRLQNRLRLVTAENSVFGPTVTVTGLLTGADVAKTLETWRRLGYDNDWTVLVPNVIFNNQGLTLDDWTLDDLSQRTGYRFIVLDSTGADLAKLWSQKRRVRFKRCIHE
ncbi:MAG: DUF512 domain-containing protein [Firmicutes bacterium]|nr:DUF512 domain-containing protein [Bacillota bacterium]